jgi:outer membrane lipoprotein-sorting protein
MVSFRSHLAANSTVKSARGAHAAGVLCAAARREEPPCTDAVGPLSGAARGPRALVGTLAMAAVIFMARLPAAAADLDPALKNWINAQTNIHTWTADFTQTRTLKSLSQPLVATGHVWFVAPNKFRWEIGDPPQTIAVRQTENILILYPRLKLAERYPLGGDKPGPWRDTLALFEAGFPRGPAEVERRFRILSLAKTNDVHEVTLQPRAAAARRLMPQVKIAFATNDFSLRGTELQFSDGSTMRNEFRKAKTNTPVDDTFFSPHIGPDYKISEPLSK